MMRSRPAFSFIVVAALVLGACSSGDSSNGDPTVPIPTAGTVTVHDSEPDQHAVDRAFDRLDDDLDQSGHQRCANRNDDNDDGPPTTLIRPADLVTDPNDPNNLHTSLPEHQPIIDAYVAAINAELITYSRWPLDPTSTGTHGAPRSATR